MLTAVLTVSLHTPSLRTRLMTMSPIPHSTTSSCIPMVRVPPEIQTRRFISTGGVSSALHPGHSWRDGHSFSYVHVSSPDMLQWTWYSRACRNTGSSACKSRNSLSAAVLPLCRSAYQKADTALRDFLQNRVNSFTSGLGARTPESKDGVVSPACSTSASWSGKCIAFVNVQ